MSNNAKPKQSRLESDAIDARQELVIKNDYQRDVNEYSFTHPDAISDGDKLGKGTGMSMGITIPGQTTNRAISYSNFVTSDDQSPSGTVGGLYDIEGYGALKGKSGRNYINSINLYRKGDEYGAESVDTKINVNDGQIIVNWVKRTE